MAAAPPIQKISSRISEEGSRKRSLSVCVTRNLCPSCVGTFLLLSPCVSWRRRSEPSPAASCSQRHSQNQKKSFCFARRHSKNFPRIKPTSIARHQPPTRSPPNSEPNYCLDRRLLYLVIIDQAQFLTPTDARLVGGSQINAQAPQQQAYSRSSAGATQTQPLPLAHQATISPLDKYYGQQQQAAQPLATNATINGNNNKHLSNEVDDKLRGFNIHQLRTLAKHKSISTSINKDPMIEKIKSVYRFKSAQEITEVLNNLNPTQRPYQYAFTDPESNPLMAELRKINNKIELIVERVDAIEKSQKDIRDALSIICNRSQFTGVSSVPNSREQRIDDVGRAFDAVYRGTK